jgi:hypothetical protein
MGCDPRTLLGRTMAAAVALSLSCSAPVRAPSAPTTPSVDATFARTAMDTISGGGDYRTALLAHPALASLVGHQRMVGNADTEGA